MSHVFTGIHFLRCYRVLKSCNNTYVLHTFQISTATIQALIDVRFVVRKYASLCSFSASWPIVCKALLQVSHAYSQLLITYIAAYMCLNIIVIVALKS